MKIVILVVLLAIHICSYATEIITSKPLINFTPEKDCTKPQELRNTSAVFYEQYASCKIDLISTALSGIIIRHEKDNKSASSISSVTFNFSISANGKLEDIYVSADQNMDQVLTMKLRARLSMLRLEPQEFGVISHSYKLIIN